LPEIDPDRPASQWQLSEQGRARCITLAEKISVFQPAVIVSSLEQKTQETAAILALRFGLQVKVIEELHEHERGNEPYLASPELFRARIKELFQHPKQLVYGTETALQTLARYTTAIHCVISEHMDQNIVVVSHGTVMSLFVAHYNRLDAYQFWLNLAIPDIVVLSLPDFLLTRQ
jgi:broad specificity phosphatase PhoE